MGNGLAAHEKAKTGSTDVWLTPLNIVHTLGLFDLDPCGESDHLTAHKIYTENGLEKEWYGRVWLNTPYSEVSLWLDKMANHNNGIALVFARLDTKWAQKTIPKCTSVFFPARRISFLNKGRQKSKNNAGAPSMYLSFGEIPDWLKLGPGLIWGIK